MKSKNSWDLFKGKNDSKVLVLGHRGSPLRERENTIKSFKRAIEEGADGVELDVRPTLDNHLVVSHDNSLERVFGAKIRIEDSTLDEIWKVAPEIPLFSSVLDALGPVWYDIEIKADKPIGFRKEVVDLLWKEIKDKKDFHAKMMLSSFNPIAMRRAEKVTGDIFPMGIIYDGPPTTLPSICRKGQGRLIFHCSFLKPEWDIAERERKDKPKWPICPWTVDTEEEIKRMIPLSVPLIITNDPLVAVRTLQEENLR
ncbi:MAG: glycerophosphodiester phosphodiesterase [Candidatus Ornithospirochaeta sp.]